MKTTAATIGLFVLLLTFGFATVSRAAAPPAAQDRIRVSSRAISSGEKNGRHQWQLLVMVKPEKPLKNAGPIISYGTSLQLDSITPQSAGLEPDRFSLFYVAMSSDVSAKSKNVAISFPHHADAAVSFTLTSAMELTDIPWQRHCLGEGSTLAQIKAAPSDDLEWSEIRIPQMWEDLGVTWIRTKVLIPKSYAEIPCFLTISAVDDNDITFFNGKEIGRTNGWDVLREYPVPKELIRFGELNEIAVAVHNTNAGGGIAGPPVLFGERGGKNTGVLFPQPEIQPESRRRAQGKIGNPLPLRPMRVRDGVLEYEDGGEVALWGVNYYPQSWNEYRFLKEQNADFRKVVDTDLDDLVRDKDPLGPNRINAIRIHVFDTEISDAEGNLVRNEHLDILDYLVGQCNERGIYLWLTPIAWWGSPGGRSDAFSSGIPMQAMTTCKETWAIQQRFFKQFLEHENPYTKRRLVDEPCLVLFELINEPHYWTLGQLLDLASRPHGRVWTKEELDGTADDPNVSYRRKLREEWQATLPGPQWECSDAWEFFLYARIREYIDTMSATIRQTGAKQPIAYTVWAGKPFVYPAVADSACEAITSSNYPGGLQQTPHADSRNLLPQMADDGWPVELTDKARLVYEFDASDTLKQIDLYPAMGRYYRNRGVQVACQFQYDSRFNAAHNQAWPTHYLNAAHVPERFVSFLIAGETFRTLPRGTTLTPEDSDVWIFPPTAVSYSKNAALLCKDDLFMQARPTPWLPLPLPKSPKRIIAVGSTPYFDYDGTGTVDVTVHDKDKTVEIRLNDDVVRLRGDVLRGTPQEPLTRLETGPHHFRLKLPGWDKAALEVQTDSGWKRLADSPDGAFLESGKVYRFKR